MTSLVNQKWKAVAIAEQWYNGLRTKTEANKRSIARQLEYELEKTGIEPKEVLV